MVVGAFPLAKLGVLLVRQISKPIAGYIKAGAKRSHIFRNYVCLPTAQFYHWAETRYKLWVMGFGKPAKVTPLNEQLAVEVGADILSEVFIFSIAAGLLTAEYIRSSAKSQAKEEAQENRLRSMEAKLIELDLLCEQQQAQLRQFERNSFSSPLRALKEKLIPSSTEPSKTDQKIVAGGSTISAPPGTRIVTLEWDDVFPEHSRHDAAIHNFLPIPQWTRPFVGPIPESSSSSSTSLTEKSAMENGASSSLSTGTVNSLNVAAAVPPSDSDEIRTGSSKGDVYTSRVIRRAIKILMNTYEEMEED